MRKLLVMAFALATVVVAGCSSDTSLAPSQASIAGAWNLASIDGLDLPYVAQAANPKIEVVSDQLLVDADGTFTESAQLRYTDGSTVTMRPYADSGTYMVSGTTASFGWSNGSIGTAKISGRTITVDLEGYSYVFTQQ